MLAANHQRLKKHSSASGHPIVVIPAQNSGDEPHMKNAPANEAEGLEPELCLAIGAPVMCTWNGWVEAGIMNGALGTVDGIIYAEGEVPPAIPEAVLVQYASMEINSRGSTHFHSMWEVTSGASLNETHAAHQSNAMQP